MCLYFIPVDPPPEEADEVDYCDDETNDVFTANGNDSITKYQQKVHD